MHANGDWPEVGHDDLDVPGVRALRTPRWWPQRRLTLGSAPTSTPALLFVVIGLVCGPHGLNVLSPAAIANSQALIWVGLAVIGVFIGLGLSAPSTADKRALLVTSAAIAVTTLVIMAAGVYLVSVQVAIPLPGPPAVAALLVALCTSVSAALPVAARASLQLVQAASLADLDDVPLVFGGGLVLAMLTGDLAAMRIVATVAAGAGLGLAGSLLFSHASETERGLFVTGTVLLLAGVAAYLGTSPLVSGCVAAVVWSRLPGTADRISGRDLRVLQHPLVVLILVFAGATLEFTLVAVWMAALALVLRLAAKLLVSVLMSRRAAASPVLLASMLLQPGILGVALAMNTWLLVGNDYRWLVSAVVLATAASEVMSLFQPVPWDTAS